MYAGFGLENRLHNVLQTGVGARNVLYLCQE